MDQEAREQKQKNTRRDARASDAKKKSKRGVEIRRSGMTLSSREVAWVDGRNMRGKSKKEKEVVGPVFDKRIIFFYVRTITRFVCFPARLLSA